jgi:hypothetical protein
LPRSIAVRGEEVPAKVGGEWFYELAPADAKIFKDFVALLMRSGGPTAHRLTEAALQSAQQQTDLD